MRRKVFILPVFLLLICTIICLPHGAVADSRNVSGYNHKTNNTINWCGVAFSYPSYFNMLEESTADSLVHSYPEEEEFYASLVFQSADFSGTAEEFTVYIPYIVESTIESLGVTKVIDESREVSFAGLRGWRIVFTTLDDDNDGIISKGVHSFAYNEKSGKVVMIHCLYDNIDQSQYDYFGDYYKMLSEAKLTDSHSQVTEQYVRITYNTSVNIRETPDAKGKRIGTAKPGQTFVHLETSDNGWHKIRLENGEMGWVSGKMGVVDETTAELPERSEAEPLDLEAINSTNTEKQDAQFIGKYYRITGIVGEAYGPSDGQNALVTIHPEVMARGMASQMPLDINVWLTPDEFERIGGSASEGKQIDLDAKLTSIRRNAISDKSSVRGYPIQLEFGEAY